MGSINRYYLVEEGPLESRYLFSKRERLEDFYKTINEYNSKKTNKYFIGDLSFNANTRTFYYRKYRKLVDPYNLKILDSITTKLENENSLKFYLNVICNNKIFIAYRVNKRIKLINVFYRKDTKYLNEYFLESKFIEYSNNKDFLKRIFNDSFISSFPFSKNEFDELASYVELECIGSSKYVKDFFEAFCHHNNSSSYINLRYLSNIMREFELSIFNTLEGELVAPDNLDGQLMIDGYEVGCLSHFYEDIRLGEISRDEVLKKLVR